MPISTAEIMCFLEQMRLLGQQRSLPGGMSELDVPRPILMDVNRIRYYFNIIRIVAEKIGEDGAD